MATTWAELGIDLGSAKGGGAWRKTTCPQCSHTRKKASYPCLNVNEEEGAYKCWHCDWHGKLSDGRAPMRTLSRPPKVYRRPAALPVPPPPDKLMEWFTGRGIPRVVVERRKLYKTTIYMPQVEDEVPVIAFPYYRDGELINVKYRDKDKNFRMEAGAERILYGLDMLTHTEGQALIITEGEIDALSVNVLGHWDVLSVPDGAPSPTTKDYTTKFDFLESAHDILASYTKIILAGDNDTPGTTLTAELARRLGVERCWTVTWPEGCKDANEVLTTRGSGALQSCLDAAEPWPITGLIQVSSLREQLEALYIQGAPRTYSTGWVSVNQYYTVMPGELTVLTGATSMGKSRWMSNLVINMAQEHGWRFAVFSPESTPVVTTRLYAEQYLRKSFHPGHNRMTMDELWQAEDWLSDHITHIAPGTHVAASITGILDLAKIEVGRKGVQGVIIDPWSYVAKAPDKGQNLTHYIAEKMTELKIFCATYGVHIWLVAHPTKPRKAEKGDYAGKYPPATLYDISDSAHFANGADVGVSVWHDFEAQPTSYLTEIHILKVRNEYVGKPGMVKLTYDPWTKTYSDTTMSDTIPHWPSAS